VKRRTFIVGLGAAATWPLVVRAQQGALPIVGFLSSGSSTRAAKFTDLFRRGLGEAGYAEDRNVAIQYRFSEDHVERIPDLAAELVRRQVAVIGATGIPAARAAQAATKTIPIVFGVGGDPVNFGLVANLNRPGGNITGISTLSVELTSKRLELLHELVPAAGTIGLLIDPTNVNAQTLLRDASAAAAVLGLQIRIVQASSEGDFDKAFAALAEVRTAALVITNTALFNNRADQLGALALRYAMPAVFQFPEFATAGGVMSYGDNSGGTARLVGVYVGRILKGEKPGDLPVQLTTGTELIVNLKTAKALGLTVPLSLLGRADEVIE
jgi:putative tryptophan/tyrosine transport system substrate-binding protein